MKASLMRFLLLGSIALGVTAAQANACSPFVEGQRFAVRERKPVRNTLRVVLPPYGNRQAQAFVVEHAQYRGQPLRLQSGGCGALLLLK